MVAKNLLLDSSLKTFCDADLIAFATCRRQQPALLLESIGEPWRGAFCARRSTRSPFELARPQHTFCWRQQPRTRGDEHTSEQAGEQRVQCASLEAGRSSWRGRKLGKLKRDSAAAAKLHPPRDFICGATRGN